MTDPTMVSPIQWHLKYTRPNMTMGRMKMEIFELKSKTFKVHQTAPHVESALGMAGCPISLCAMDATRIGANTGAFNQSTVA